MSTQVYNCQSVAEKENFDFGTTTLDNENYTDYTSTEEEEFTPLTSSSIIEYNTEYCDEIVNPLYNNKIANPIFKLSEEFNDSTRLTFNETSSIEDEEFTPITSSTIVECNFECSNIINPLYIDCSELNFNETSCIEEFTPLTSSSIIDCSNEIVNPLFNNCSYEIVNPLYQQLEDFNECSQESFNDTSSIEEEEFTPITSSTIFIYRSECNSKFVNPLYSDKVVNPIFQLIRNLFKL